VWSVFREGGRADALDTYLPIGPLIVQFLREPGLEGCFTASSRLLPKISVRRGEAFHFPR
jgi:hypothetical protein